MCPMFRGKVVERQEHIPILCQALAGAREFLPIVGNEGMDHIRSAGEPDKGHRGI